jgi:hypothetical protein
MHKSKPTNMNTLKKTIFIFCLLIILTISTNAQVGIGTTSPQASAILDITASDKGILIPRVSLTGTNDVSTIASPATGLFVYNTASAGSGSLAVEPGFYYFNSNWNKLSSSQNSWSTKGNYSSATGSFGTLSSNHVDFLTNGIVRGRMTNLGEFNWGTTHTPQAGDLMAAVGNSQFPWALNGYSSQNGSGVYGSITGGTTTFAGVQGEYYGSVGTNTAAVRGLNGSTVAGTGFRVLATTGPRVGIEGRTVTSGGQYTFGVYGSMGSTDIRCGAIIGDDFGIAMGAIGYYASTMVDYSVYGFGQAHQNGIATGRSQSLTEPNTQIGLGIYGGVMGGWMKGLVYGTHVKGERYSLYVDGKTYTNSPITELVNTGGENRQPAYAVTSLTTDMYAKGKGQLTNGEANIELDPAFLKMVSADPDDLVITVTPTSSSTGLYIAKQSATGFVIKENQTSNGKVSFNWIVVATRKDNTAMQHSPEILKASFDKRMDAVMFNDNNTKDTPGNLWWDGHDVRFDQPPARNQDLKVHNISRKNTNIKNN